MTEINIAQGWHEIAKVLVLSESVARRKKEKLMAAGVIFVVRKGKGKRRVMCGYVDVLKAYRMKLSIEGEYL